MIFWVFYVIIWWLILLNRDHVLTWLMTCWLCWVNNFIIWWTGSLSLSLQDASPTKTCNSSPRPVFISLTHKISTLGLSPIRVNNSLLLSSLTLTLLWTLLTLCTLDTKTMTITVTAILLSVNDRNLILPAVLQVIDSHATDCLTIPQCDCQTSSLPSLSKCQTSPIIKRTCSGKCLRTFPPEHAWSFMSFPLTFFWTHYTFLPSHRQSRSSHKQVVKSFC